MCSRPRTLRSTVGYVAVLVLLATCATVKTPEHSLVKAYTAAEPVTPTWNPDITPTEPMWNARVDLGTVSVTVLARCCVGGRFVAQYSDERDLRVVFQPGDYVYPRALRLDRRGKRIYGMASGLAAGINNTTKIFGYDLAARRLLDAVEVEPHILPPAMEPLEPRPR
jgi:hypothetical protein